MRNSPVSIIFLALMVIMDLYVFAVIKTLAQAAGPRTKTIIYTSYWVISLLAILVLLVMPYLNFDQFPRGFRNTLFAVVIALFFAKLIASVFFLIDDIRRGIQWVAAKVYFARTELEQTQSDGHISRSVFLSWFGMAVGGGLFGSLLYGLTNKYQYTVRKQHLKFPNLPAAFRGLKVVQLSDIHSGSFTDKAAVERGIEKVLSLDPDLILFTGDLVNNKAEEMQEYVDVFARLKAPMGVYSILGNHDYGDYVAWPTPEEKTANLDRLKAVHAAMGWKLLLNEHVMLEREGEHIALLGVENWSSKARFPKYGKLRDAHSGTDGVPFKILLSHDPSHWESEVTTGYPDIDLMLAGHTHGMQFGVEIPWLKWSPVQYVYKQWAGIYRQGNQQLYVNRGFGFLGYPGRVGILPEITLLHFS